MESWVGRHKLLAHSEWARFERRGTRRIEVLSGLLPGELFCADRGEPFAAVSVNVSENGLAVETEYLLEIGSQVVLQLPQPFSPVQLKVVWCDWADLGHSKLRCGMVQVGTSYDLEDIFRKYGCLEVKAPD